MDRSTMKPSSTSKTMPKKFTPDQKKFTHQFMKPTTSSGSKAKSNVSHIAFSRKQNLETTFHANETQMGRGRSPALTLNATLVPTVDWNLECDFAYNEYLQALMKKQIIQNKANKLKQSISDQLSIYSESLFNDTCKVEEAEREIELAKLHNRMGVVLTEISATLSLFIEICTKCELEKYLDEIIDLLDGVKNRISLQNVVPLQTQAECEKLLSLLQESNTILTKMKSVSGDDDKLGMLAQTLSTTLVLKQEIVKKDGSMEGSQSSAGYTVLKTLSDHFANLRKL